MPLVYACSGCASSAQVAYAVAVRLDRRGKTEMGCIAGVGGGVPSHVADVQAGRDILSIDGCGLQCVMHCLARHGARPTWRYNLLEYGLKMQKHVDADPADIDRIEELILNDLPFLK